MVVGCLYLIKRLIKQKEYLFINVSLLAISLYCLLVPNYQNIKSRNSFQWLLRQHIHK